MKRLYIKSTESAIAIMSAVSEKRHCDIADLVHQYFYQLAIDDLNQIDTISTTDIALSNIFEQAIKS
ncbi:MAG: hypothetical protein GQ475_07465 [Methylococcaceae bacterium]|nr:hypothetical protein [Methylococcaceae bacterium]